MDSETDVTNKTFERYRKKSVELYPLMHYENMKCRFIDR